MLPFLSLCIIPVVFVSFRTQNAFVNAPTLSAFAFISRSPFSPLHDASFHCRRRVTWKLRVIRVTPTYRYYWPLLFFRVRFTVSIFIFQFLENSDLMSVTFHVTMSHFRVACIPCFSHSPAVMAAIRNCHPNPSLQQGERKSLSYHRSSSSRPWVDLQEMQRQGRFSDWSFEQLGDGGFGNADGDGWGFLCALLWRCQRESAVLLTGEATFLALSLIYWLIHRLICSMQFYSIADFQ